MISKNLDEQRFLRIYRGTLVALALAWRSVLFINLVRSDWVVAAVLVLYAWGLAPYLALVGLAARFRPRPLLLVSSALLFGGDILTGVGVLRPGSSTDVVALFTYPLFAIIGLIPLTWILGWLLNR